MDGKYRQNYNRFYFPTGTIQSRYIFILSVIMEASRDQFTATELLLYDEAMEEWYAQRDPEKVKREERNCMRLARQFCHLMKKYKERFFTYVLFHPSTRSVAAHLESYLLHVYYTPELDNLHDDKEIDQLELYWITWHRTKRGVIVELVYLKHVNCNIYD